jgi:hypothetical protein
MQFGLVGVLKRCCTMGADLTRALTGARPIKLTSPRCPSAWQPNHGRRSTYRRGKTVQTTETTSKHIRIDGQFAARMLIRVMDGFFANCWGAS